MSNIVPSIIVDVPQVAASASHDLGRAEKLLDAVVLTGGLTGPGNTLGLIRANRGQINNFTWQVLIAGTGSLSALTVNLEGSIDGINWFTLDTSTIATGEARSVAYKPVILVRANVAASTVASGAPTITVYFCA